VAQAIIDAGLTLQNVIRTRVMLTDMSRWEEAARAHGEVFATVKPACTFVEVKGFINREWLVELEADYGAKRRGEFIPSIERTCPGKQGHAAHVKRFGGNPSGGV